MDDLVMADEVDGVTVEDLDVQRAYTVRDGCVGWLARADGTDKDGRSRFVASTGEPDRHGDVVEQSWRLANWRRNPVLLHEHATPVVGRGTASVDKMLDALLLLATWDDSDHNPIGRLVAHQHREGYRSAASVGFRPGKMLSRAKLGEDDPRRVQDVPEWEAGYLYKFNELLEVSSVAIPANASALQIRSYSMEEADPEEQVRRYLREATPRALRSLIADVLRERPAALSIIRSAALCLPSDPPPAPTGAPTRIRWIQPREEA